MLYASGYAKSALPLQLGLNDDIAFLRKPHCATSSARPSVSACIGAPDDQN